MGFLKKKHRERGGVSLLLFWAGASGFQDVSQDNGLGKGPGCSQVQEGQSEHQSLRLAQMSIVCGGRVSIKLWATKQVRITEYWAVLPVGKLA